MLSVTNADIVFAKDMKIYTKKGDLGKTSLYLSKKRLAKSKKIFTVLGTVDELNASLGLASKVKIKSVQEVVISIQNDLFYIGFLLASPSRNQNLFEQKTLNLEKNIDKFDSQLPPLKNFILPSGSVYSIYFHISRAVCRRLERNLVLYIGQKRKGFTDILKYINRLSDLLFVLARYVNYRASVRDIIWKL